MEFAFMCAKLFLHTLVWYTTEASRDGKLKWWKNLHEKISRKLTNNRLKSRNMLKNLYTIFQKMPSHYRRSLSAKLTYVPRWTIIAHIIRGVLGRISIQYLVKTFFSKSWKNKMWVLIIPKKGQCDIYRIWLWKYDRCWVINIGSKRMLL